MPFLLVIVSVALAGASAAAALSWAIKSGQFKDLSRGATSLFDDEAQDPEPPDTFPKGPSGE